MDWYFFFIMLGVLFFSIIVGWRYFIGPKADERLRKIFPIGTRSSRRRLWGQSWMRYEDD